MKYPTSNLAVNPKESDAVHGYIFNDNLVQSVRVSIRLAYLITLFTILFAALFKSIPIVYFGVAFGVFFIVILERLPHTGWDHSAQYLLTAWGVKILTYYVPQQRCSSWKEITEVKLLCIEAPSGNPRGGNVKTNFILLGNAAEGSVIPFECIALEEYYDLVKNPNRILIPATEETIEYVRRHNTIGWNG